MEAYINEIKERLIFRFQQEFPGKSDMVQEAIEDQFEKLDERWHEIKPSKSNPWPNYQEFVEIVLLKEQNDILLEALNELEDTLNSISRMGGANHSWVQARIKRAISESNKLNP